MNLLQAMDDKNLFRPWFRDPATWATWKAFVAALFALPMDDDQLAVFRKHTRREAPPEAVAREAWLVCGRRAGKSAMLALIGVYLACFFNYRRYLAPGERGTILIIAADRKQARHIARYARALLTGIPMLRRMLEREVADAFDLNNRVSIEIATASGRSVRGFTLVAALLDEVAFWPTDDSANPDYAVLDALRPAMATIPNAMLLCASSPHARRGALWDAYKRWYGKEGGPLVWQADTRSMNPTVPQRIIDEALERDTSAAQAEYLAQFRADLEPFVRREVVEACVSPGVHERPYDSAQTYFAFVDPSGGAADSMTLAIGHREKDIFFLDLVREKKPPFSPEAVVAEFRDSLRAYGVATVSGDRYAGEWAREPFRKAGIEYRLAEKPRSDLYLHMLPQLTSGRVDLLDDPRLVNQIVGLERRVARGGRESIDHTPGGHDDVANAVAGVIHLLATQQAPIIALTGRQTMPGFREPLGSALFSGREYLAQLRNQ